MIDSFIFMYFSNLSLYFSWHQQHENMEKLNMQAIVNAAAKEDEFVKEFFISYDKVTENTINQFEY